MDDHEYSVAGTACQAKQLVLHTSSLSLGRKAAQASFCCLLPVPGCQ